MVKFRRQVHYLTIDEAGKAVSALIDNLLVRIHVIILMIRWFGLAPWEFEFPFAGALPDDRRGGQGCLGQAEGSLYEWVLSTSE